MGKLSREDQAKIDEFDRAHGRYLDTINRARQFKLDDFLILRISYYGNKIAVQTNTYGAPIKYRVVHVDDHGVPFVKRINKNGEPVGPLSSCIGMAGDEYFRDNATVFTWELDPDFTDSIILQDSYDPGSLHRSKKDIWKAVTEHNKACKVHTRDIKNLVVFLESVNAGDTLWTSNVSSYFIEDKKYVDPTNFIRFAKGYLTTREVKLIMTLKTTIVSLTIRDKHGRVREVTPDFFHYKALYKDRPRTYKELNI